MSEFKIFKMESNTGMATELAEIKAEIALTKAEIAITEGKLAKAETDGDFARRDQLEIILISQTNSLTSQTNSLNSQTNDKVELERKENRLAENGKFLFNCHVYSKCLLESPISRAFVRGEQRLSFWLMTISVESSDKSYIFHSFH